MNQDTQALPNAIARNTGIVLSLPSAGMVRNCKSRFLGETDEGIWVETNPQEHPLLDELIREAAAIGVSFKGSARLVTFRSRVIRRDPAYPFNAATIVPAALLEKPAHVDTSQRRSFYRIRIVDTESVTVKIWRIPEHVLVKDRPLASQAVRFELVDLSSGGMGGYLLPDADGQIKAVPQERVRIQLQYGQEEAIIEGRMRLTDNSRQVSKCRVGVAFQKLQSDLDGRRTLALLTRIVGDLQREEVKRRKHTAA